MNFDITVYSTRNIICVNVLMYVFGNRNVLKFPLVKLDYCVIKLIVMMSCFRRLGKTLVFRLNHVFNIITNKVLKVLNSRKNQECVRLFQGSIKLSRFHSVTIHT